MHPQWGQQSANRYDTEGQVSNNPTIGSSSDYGSSWDFAGTAWRDMPWLSHDGRDPNSAPDSFGAASGGSPGTLL